MREDIFRGKTAIVTGGSRGIGRAFCNALAERGCNIVMNYNSRVDDAVVKELEAKGVQVCTFQADVSSFDACGRLVDYAVEQFGTVDFLVNNAGVIKDSMIKKMTEEHWDKILDIDAKSVFNMTRHIYPVFEAKWKANGEQGFTGSIVNMCSATAFSANIGQANYGAAKAAVAAFTMHTAREYAKIGVTCNALAPGFIVSDITNALQGEARDRYLNTIPLKRAGTGEDVAETGLFLLRSDYMTGQIVHIDGGLIMQY